MSFKDELVLLHQTATNDIIKRQDGEARVLVDKIKKLLIDAAKEGKPKIAYDFKDISKTIINKVKDEFKRENIKVVTPSKHHNFITFYIVDNQYELDITNNDPFGDF